MMRVLLNGRPKGTSDHCGEHEVQIEATSDKDAWDQIHKDWEHVTSAMILGDEGRVIDREDETPWT